MLNELEKRKLLKDFSEVFIILRGKGPENIYIKDFETEVWIYFEGVISKFEQSLIDHYDKDMKETIIGLYRKSAMIESGLQFDKTKKALGLELYVLGGDMDVDKFIYKMKYMKGRSIL